MLRIIQNNSSAGAKSYYSTADYYSEGQELTGSWRGKGAARLGLAGEIRQEDWNALCENRDPRAGTPLTPRTKQNRRVGYDFNFHVPKSVSLLYGLTQDDRILNAFRQSVDATMRDMEAEMATRVRGQGRDGDRTTGNMVWGEFVHTTARPVGGIPDPHLHAHCFVFNTTWDGEESRWKAGQFAGLKRDAPYFEAVFHSRLARRMEELGLETKRTRNGWELAELPSSALGKFSRRTALIEAKARAMGLDDASAKGELGAKTRERKATGLSLGALRGLWLERLSADEAKSVERLERAIGSESRKESKDAAMLAVAHAVHHCFERSAVVPLRRLEREALKRGYGLASSDSVTDAIARQELIAGELDGVRLVTARDVLAEESRMLGFARDGRGACSRLGGDHHTIKRDWLNEGQRQAVRHVLASRDRVTLLRGGAGTGKTSMMHEAVEGIEANGLRVHVFAPSAEASRGVLRDAEGFHGADTVARLLLDERLQADIRGQVIWIDEAGLLGSRTMAQVFDLADRLDARVILSGDRGQHGSVERGSALRLLEEEAGIRPAELREIQRQQGDYKEAVRALSEGRIADGFRQLDRLGRIREVGDVDRYKALAQDYVNSVSAGESALVVSPTHLEGEWVTDEIRSHLKQMGQLTGDERRIAILENANLTEAERADPVNYGPGDVLVFHQNAKGFRKGERLKVGGDGIPANEAARFQVFHPSILPVAPGDILRVTRNGTTKDGKHRLDNGARFTVKDFDANGNIVLTNGWTIDKDYGHLAHGYCVTSHASQGKTVDRVLIGQSAESFPASSREQFYVSVSRGRRGVTVYTDDKESLLHAVSRSDDRLTATEFVHDRIMRDRSETLRRQEGLYVPNSASPRAAGPKSREVTHER